MGGTRVDRLIVEAPTLSESEGRQLALHVAAGLAAAGGMPAVGDIPVLRVEAVARPNRYMSQLASQIIRDVLRQLEQGA